MNTRTPEELPPPSPTITHRLLLKERTPAPQPPPAPLLQSLGPPCTPTRLAPVKPASLPWAAQDPPQTCPAHPPEFGPVFLGGQSIECPYQWEETA